MSDLKPATYVIKSTNGSLVGRDKVEDKSMFPKRVLLLPEDTPEVPIVVQFNVEYIYRR